MPSTALFQILPYVSPSTAHFTFILLFDDIVYQKRSNEADEIGYYIVSTIVENTVNSMIIIWYDVRMMFKRRCIMFYNHYP